MTKLLTEQELRLALRDAEYFSHIQGKTVYLNLEPNAEDMIVAFIQSQKLAHADMVIGEDKTYKTATADEMKTGWHIYTLHNQLRKEQRERNKL